MNFLDTRRPSPDLTFPSARFAVILGIAIVSPAAHAALAGPSQKGLPPPFREPRLQNSPPRAAGYRNCIVLLAGPLRVSLWPIVC